MISWTITYILYIVNHGRVSRGQGREGEDNKNLGDRERDRHTHEHESGIAWAAFPLPIKAAC